jgi:hypothetical protein
LKPLPYPHPEELIDLHLTAPGVNFPDARRLAGATSPKAISEALATALPFPESARRPTGSADPGAFVGSNPAAGTGSCRYPHEPGSSLDTGQGATANPARRVPVR